MTETSRPTFTALVPVLGIGSYDEAVAHYVDWLGFQIDWEWREAPGRPVILSISRGGLTLMLNEADLEARGSSLTLKITNLQALADECNERRPGGISVELQAPYDIPSIFVPDPWGNRLNIQQPFTEEEKRAMAELAERMREYVRERVDSGAALPSPEDVVKAIGKPVGLAMEVLGQFSGSK